MSSSQSTLGHHRRPNGWIPLNHCSLALTLAGLMVALGLSAASVENVHAAEPVPVTVADTSPDALLAAAARVLAQIDAGNYAALWQNMPPVLQTRFQQDAFLTSMKSTRQSVGALRQRTWSSVARLRYADPQTPQGVPAGLYANVEMASTTVDGRSLIERVSFRIENDGAFRFTGYLPRPTGTPSGVSSTTP